MRAFLTFLKWAGTLLVGIIIGALLPPTLQDYLAIGQPDLRYTREQLSEPERFRVLEKFIDTNVNTVYLTSVRLRVKNVAVKAGHIDRAEFAPFKIQRLPKIDVLSVDKRAIGWGETQTIEVRSLMTVALGPAKEHNLHLEVKLFDNVGRQVSRFPDGPEIVRMELVGRFTPPHIVGPKPNP